MKRMVLFVVVLLAMVFDEPMGFKIKGTSPDKNEVIVWTEMNGQEQNVRLNYTVIELMDTNSTPISGYYTDLQSAFLITGLKSDSWYGLHLSIRYRWKGIDYIDPAHDVAFKTLSDTNTTITNGSTESTPTENSGHASAVSMAARPISGGFQLRILNDPTIHLVDTPMSARVTSDCAIGQSLGGLYHLDQTDSETKDFLLNATLLPEPITQEAPETWAAEACHNVCWSVFMSAANTSYVLESHCANLTDIFNRTAADKSLWEERDEELQHKDENEYQHGRFEGESPHNESNHNAASITRYTMGNKVIRYALITVMMIGCAF